jgi:uncharacterized protein YggL (DUF469 family)
VKKRLRKKRHLGEFIELGFEISFRLAEGLLEARIDRFYDDFLEAVKARGLMCGGGCGRTWQVFIARTRRQSATEEDRQAIREWLTRHPQVRDVAVRH